MPSQTRSHVGDQISQKLISNRRIELNMKWLMTWLMKRLLTQKGEEYSHREAIGEVEEQPEAEVDGGLQWRGVWG